MEIDARAAMRLFQSIVAQAAQDAVEPDKKYSRIPLRTRKGESEEAYALRWAKALEARYINANRERTEARHWLLNDTDGFPVIVSHAGFDPVDVRERARKLEADGWPQHKISKTEYALAA